MRHTTITIIIILVLALAAGGYVWFYGMSAVTFLEQSPTDRNTNEDASSDQGERSEHGASTFATAPMIIGTVPVQASIADEQDERVQGLSGVPRLLPDEVKLFVFPYDEKWSFWMKDMRISIDMIWVDASSTIVYIEENVAPETFPKTFEPTKPARYVIETVAGFAAEHDIGTGDTVVLPENIAN